MCDNTFARTHNIIDNVSRMHFFIEIMFYSECGKISYSGSHNKQNLTLMIISYEIYETRERLLE